MIGYHSVPSPSIICLPQKLESTQKSSPISCHNLSYTVGYQQKYFVIRTGGWEVKTHFDSLGT